MLIGWCAVLEGQLQAQRVPEGLAGRLRPRLVGAGLLPEGASEREFRQGVNDLTTGCATPPASTRGGRRVCLSV